jgi:Mrp family chromosome partitioning ATPase
VAGVSGEFDFVIIDCPSITAAVDAQIIARQTSGLMLVAKYMHSTQSQIETCCKELEQAGATLAGVAFNSVGARDYHRHLNNYLHYTSKKQ